MTLRLNIGSSVGTYALSWGGAEVTLGLQILHSIRSFYVFPQLCVIYLLHLIQRTGEGLAEVLQVGQPWAVSSAYVYHVYHVTFIRIRSNFFSNPSKDRSHEIYQMSVVYLYFMEKQFPYCLLNELQVLKNATGSNASTQQIKKYSHKQGGFRKKGPFWTWAYLLLVHLHRYWSTVSKVGVTSSFLVISALTVSFVCFKHVKT